MVIDGHTLRETFYLRPSIFTTEVVVRDMPLAEYFLADNSSYHDARPLTLPLFSFYRDMSAPILPYPGGDRPSLQPLDFVNHDVHIVVTELDRPGRLRVNYKERKIHHCSRRKLLEVHFPGAYEEFAGFVRERLARIVLNPHVLFAHVSTSGLGIRLGFYVKKRIESQQQYEETCAALASAAADGELQPDTSTYNGKNYWFLPLYPVYLNRNCLAV